MRIKETLKVREIVNEHVILLPSKNGDKSTRILSLNSTSYYLWSNLADKDFEEVDAVELLCSRFEVSEEQAALDVSKWVAQLKEYGVFE